MNEMKFKEIKDRLKAISPGPWIRCGVRHKMTESDCIMVGPENFLIAGLPIGRTHKSQAGAIADAEFIAHAPTDIADLIEEIERLQSK